MRTSIDIRRGDYASVLCGDGVNRYYPVDVWDEMDVAPLEPLDVSIVHGILVSMGGAPWVEMEDEETALYYVRENLAIALG